jgi:hypothetical protein
MKKQNGFTTTYQRGVRQYAQPSKDLLLIFDEISVASKFRMTKTISLYLLLIIAAISYCSCNNTPQITSIPAAIPDNDTTKALKMLFDSTVDLPRLVDVDLLYKNNPFGDSLIILKDTSYPPSYLPHTHKFKAMSYDEMDEAARHWPDSLGISNYLLVRFEKASDTTYSAVINNIPISRPNKTMAMCEGCRKRMIFRKKGDSLTATIGDIAEFE